MVGLPLLLVMALHLPGLAQELFQLPFVQPDPAALEADIQDHPPALRLLHAYPAVGAKEEGHLLLPPAKEAQEAGVVEDGGQGAS